MIPPSHGTHPPLYLWKTIKAWPKYANVCPFLETFFWSNIKGKYSWFRILILTKLYRRMKQWALIIEYQFPKNRAVFDISPIISKTKSIDRLPPHFLSNLIYVFSDKFVLVDVSRRLDIIKRRSKSWNNFFHLFSMI